jgi:hypothetical protein
MLLVGTLVLAASTLFLAWRDGNAALVRLGYRSLLLGVLPAWVVMRLAGQWVASKEGLTGSNVDLTWLNIGSTTGDLGLPLILISILLAGLAARRARRAQRPVGFGRASTVVVSLLLFAYLVTVWAMTTKPV